MSHPSCRGTSEPPETGGVADDGREAQPARVHHRLRMVYRCQRQARPEYKSEVNAMFLNQLLDERVKRLQYEGKCDRSERKSKQDSTIMSVMLLLGPVLGCALASGAGVESLPRIANERDKQVLQATLLYLLAADDFATDIGKKHMDHAVIVLRARTPERTGMIRPEQIQHDLGEGHRIPDDMQRDLLHRNEQAGTYSSRVAAFSDLKFDRRIVVSEIAKDSKKGRLFEKAYPSARGYAEAFLPGYTKDGSHAVVRALVGPSPHGATATVFLERSVDTWLVRWHHIAWYL